jgi:isopentenyl-diphosphate Delta-isomerase
MEHRKADHIEMAFLSQVKEEQHDDRFHYEPMLQPHPGKNDLSLEFLGKRLQVPLWVSSMTGGTYAARKINTNLAKACHEFGMGMGLGSCRSLLEDDLHLPDFDMRKIIGDNLPLYANLGISQVEQILLKKDLGSITGLVDKLRADGLIIHINPLQEWFQPGGDRIKLAPVETVRRLLDQVKFPVIVKEVGQGIGPESLRALMRIPLAAIEFAAFGGTNFSKLELMRGEQGARNTYESFAHVGENAHDMVAYVNEILSDEKVIKCSQMIISGGITNFLDGYYLLKKIRTCAVFGQASGFLRFAKESYEELHRYIAGNLNVLRLADAYLTVKDR